MTTETSLESIVKAAFREYLAEVLPQKAIEKESEPPEMVTIREVCLRTGISYNCVRYRLIPQNRIKYIRAGRRYLINWQSVIDCLNAGD